ncbi:MAG: hypothetical protein ACOVP7_12235 [Lacibacter sp.]
MKRIALIVVTFFFLKAGLAQSADTKVCECLAAPLKEGFMQATKAIYGSVGITLTPDMELKPNQLQAVKFIIPTPAVKQGCKNSYTMYIADERGAKVFEAGSATNEFVYSFPDCNKTYSVTLMVTARYADSRSAGNCTKRITISIKPNCNTTACNCASSPKGKPSISADLNINGGLECLSPTATQRRYVLRFGIVNKTNCILLVDSITVHGQTIRVPASQTAPRSETKGISLGFATALTIPSPADTKVTATVRYSLNGRKCSAIMELPYTACR